MYLCREAHGCARAALAHGRAYTLPGTSAAKHMDVRERCLYMDALIPVPGTSAAKQINLREYLLYRGASSENQSILH